MKTKNVKDIDKQLLKENILMLAKHHRDICFNSDCNVRLTLVAELLRRAGYELTDENIQLLR